MLIQNDHSSFDLMKKFCLALLLCLATTLTIDAQAATGWCAKPRQSEAGQAANLAAANPLSTRITDTLNLATGAAINPLLVVGGLGAWCWLDTPQEQRAKLPWHHQPWYWGPLLVIALLYLLGSLIGLFAPAGNKFTEAARTLEGNLQPLYTLPFLLPFVYQRFGGGIEQVDKMLASVIPSAHAAGLESMAEISMLPVLMALAFAFIYGVVWLTTQAVNAMVLLSPVPFIDILIRSAHLTYVVVLIGLSIISPFLGLLLTLPLIILALLVCGWCFRLSVFGTVIAADLLRFWRKITVNSRVLAFAARRLEGVPVRTCGKLQRTDKGLVFQYRPWLILPRRSIPLSDNEIVLERGLLYPRLRSQNSGSTVTLLALPPRYRSQEEAVAQQLGITTITSCAILRGWAAIKSWTASLFCREKPFAAEEIR